MALTGLPHQRPGCHASNEVQLAYAVEQRRVIVTQDTDFLRIVAARRETAGVTFYPDQGRSIGQVIRDLLLIWHVCESEEIRDHIEVL
jgi:hypothetical protein